MPARHRPADAGQQCAVRQLRHGISSGQHLQRAHCVQFRRQRHGFSPIFFQFLLGNRTQTVLQPIDHHPLFIQIRCGTLQRSGAGQHPQAPPARAHPLLQIRRQAGKRAAQPFAQLLLIRRRQFRRIGRRGRTQIRHIVGNRHIRLMPHRGNHRNPGRGNGAGHPLLVEGPQILHAAAAAAGNDQIRQIPPIDIANRAADLRRRFHALHPHAQNPHPAQGIPLAPGCAAYPAPPRRPVR